MNHPAQRYADADGTAFPVEQRENCAVCGKPFGEYEWQWRHNGFDGIAELHPVCCFESGPCSHGGGGHDT